MFTTKSISIQIILFLSFVAHIMSWNCESYGSNTATPMKRNFFDNNPLAVCNDGSRGGYYYAPAPNNSQFSSIYLLHLPGGGQCYDEKSCSERWNKPTHNLLMSSNGFPETCHKTGLLDSDSSINSLYGVHKLLVGYCSSDGYMG